jgi:hypothetical protein
MPHARLVGFTGHQSLSPETYELVRAELRSLLSQEVDLVGVTSLAAGADQIFARVVLDLHGRIMAVIPARRYEKSFGSPHDLETFRQLLAQADSVVDMPFDEPSEDAYWAAGQEIIRRAERMLAVWDGEPAAGLGGTADVVRFARSQGKPVTIIWPAGAARS